jgi:galactose mutarotase-like enzyme
LEQKRMADGRPTPAEKENVLIDAGACSVTLLPQLGGKISSIRLNGHELLQEPLEPLAPRTKGMPFDLSDASGWDECLPSVAACSIKTTGGTFEVPDHGDLWRVAWQRSSSNGDHSVSLNGLCFSLPLALERASSLGETTHGWQIRQSYKLTNIGKYQVPWSWAAHPLFAIDPGDTIVLPSSVTSLRVEGSAQRRLGETDSVISWPVALLANGVSADLSIAQSPQSGIGDKLFAGPLTSDANWCELHRPKAGIRIRVRFDAEATPYLGLWLCYGGWPDRPGLKQNCVALEPTTAPVDSLARSGPWSRTLGPGQSVSWPMLVDIEIM